ncbi:chaperone NapD [Gammaproteobacteria bacterium]|nr:chaperone NapD [Gammaproteobacteria bacterium]
MQRLWRVHPCLPNDGDRMAPLIDEVSQIHIASFVLHCSPKHVDALTAYLDRHPQAEIGARDGGKLVILLEAGQSRDITDFIDQVQLREGVLSTTLAYHYHETSEPSEDADYETA